MGLICIQTMSFQRLVCNLFHLIDVNLYTTDRGDLLGFVPQPIGAAYDLFTIGGNTSLIIVRF